jgi:CRP-like cAMP-binding protein
MGFDTTLLLSAGAIIKKYKKGTYVFSEGDEPHYYFQVIEGTVKVFNFNDDGREFTQAEFKAGSSFGEPPLFIGELYPSFAVTTENSVIIRLSKTEFLEFLDGNSSHQKYIIELLARRIYNKSTTSRDIINNSPDARIISFLNAYKKKISKEEEPVPIPYTRQEIANYTGLRVETVIRTLTKMKEKNMVRIVNRKLIF